MPFRADRRRRPEDPYLPHKTLLFALGAGCAFAGMYFDASWLVTIGILILAAGVLIRLAGERRRRLEQDADAYGFEDEPGEEQADDEPRP